MGIVANRPRMPHLGVRGVGRVRVGDLVDLVLGLRYVVDFILRVGGVGVRPAKDACHEDLVCRVVLESFDLIGKALVILERTAGGRY